VKPLLAALGLFASLLAALSVLWTLLLGVAMRRVWGRIPDAADPWVGAAVLAVAVASGLALYLVLLARALPALGVRRDRVRVHLVTTGLVPPIAAALAAWAAVASVRIGW
jgi:hypothetical protein